MRLRAALVVGLRGLDRERGEPCECLAELDVGGGEAGMRDVGGDDEGAAHATSQAQRHAQLAHGVQRAVHRGVIGLVQLDAHRAAAADGRAGRADAGADRGAEQLAADGVPMDDAQALLLGLVQPASPRRPACSAPGTTSTSRWSTRSGCSSAASDSAARSERRLRGGELTARAAQTGHAERERTRIDHPVGQQFLVERGAAAWVRRRRCRGRSRRRRAPPRRAGRSSSGAPRCNDVRLLAQAHADALDGGRRLRNSPPAPRPCRATRRACGPRRPRRHRTAGAEAAPARAVTPARALRPTAARPSSNSRASSFETSDPSPPATCRRRARRARRPPPWPRRRARRARPRCRSVTALDRQQLLYRGRRPSRHRGGARRARRRGHSGGRRALRA